MPEIPIALQLYSVREACADDLPGTLEAIAEMGYDGVEFAGYYEYSAEELRDILDDLGLAVAGTHTPLDTLLGDALPETIAFNKTLGNRFLIVPALPEERRDSHQAWLDTAALFNDVAARAAEFDMRVGYHNHYVEFIPMEGELPWDTFFGNTRQDVVMQVDAGNAMHGGMDPITLLERYPGRATTVHLKDYSQQEGEVLFGQGDVRWEDFFHLCETNGNTEWYIIEQESYPYPPLESVERCLQAYRERHV